MLAAQPAPVQSGRSYTIMCNMVNNVLHPSPVGQIPASIQETLNPDGSKVASIAFGGAIQGYVTYGFCGGRPVSYHLTSDDLLGTIAQSIENLTPYM